MKIFSFIMAIFFAFLISVPCADGFSVHENEVSEEQSHQEKENPDACTPFCICSCCGAQYSFLKFEILSFETFTKNIFEKISTHHNSVFFDILYGIWQPPKIC